MKIARFVDTSGEQWGVLDLDAGNIRTIAGAFEDWAPLVTSDPNAVLSFSDRSVSLESVKLVAPLSPTSKIVGVGGNYMAHLERLGVTERPASQVAFFKPYSAMVGPDEIIDFPPVTEQLDYEVELVAVIGHGSNGHRVRGAIDILGYTIGNDISARDARTPFGLDLFTMKGLDRSTPLGPWITTADELEGSGPVDLEMTLRVNGEERQRDRTGRMLWSIDEILAYIGARTSLGTGDIVFTGTTGGVGKEDGRFLQPGDLIEAEIEGIGILRNVVGEQSADRSPRD